VASRMAAGMPDQGKGAQRERHPEADALGDPRPRGQEQEVRSGDGEAVGPDRLAAALRAHQCSDGRTSRDREDAEPTPRAAESTRIASSSSLSESSTPGTPSSARPTESTRAQPQRRSARGTNSWVSTMNSSSRRDEPGAGGGRPALHCPQRRDGEQQRLAGAPGARHHDQRRHPWLAPDRPPRAHGRSLGAAGRWCPAAQRPGGLRRGARGAQDSVLHPWVRPRCSSPALPPYVFSGAGRPGGRRAWAALSTPPAAGGAQCCVGQ
jgi:hypothetical protein